MEILHWRKELFRNSINHFETLCEVWVAIELSLQYKNRALRTMKLTTSRSKVNIQKYSILIQLYLIPFFMNWSIQIVSWSLIIIVPRKLFQVEDESECNLQPWPTPTSSNLISTIRYIKRPPELCRIYYLINHEYSVMSACIYRISSIPASCRLADIYSNFNDPPKYSCLISFRQSARHSRGQRQ